MTAPLFLRGSSPEDGIFSLVREHLAYFSPGVFILYTYLSISTEYCPSFTTKTDPLIEKGFQALSCHISAWKAAVKARFSETQ